MLDDARVVVVRVGTTEFGMEVGHVREVLRLPVITRLPFPPPAILGIVSVRGTLVPVMDLGERLTGAPSDRLGRLVVVAAPDGDGLVGLLVDEVLELVPFQDDLLDPPAEVEASLPAGWIRGVLSPTPERLITVLDLQRVLELQNPAAEEPR